MKHLTYSDAPAQSMPGVEGVSIRWVIADNVNAPNFAMRVIEVQPGAATEHHAHAWEHEVFVVEGKGMVRSEQGDEQIGPGSCVYIEPNEKHQFVNVGRTVLRIICVIPSSWKKQC